MKDKTIGTTAEIGVILPPLHPRCRCAIIYKEIGERNIESVGSAGKIFKPLTAKEIADMQAAEEAAYNKKTGVDFGFKKMHGTPDWSKEILRTNPPDKLYGHTPNCQRCVVAHEARMRGYDVVARPSWGADDPLHYSWLKAFEYSYDDFKLCSGKTGNAVIKSIEEIMNSFGAGSRAIIVFKWNEAKDGHALVAQCLTKGRVNIGDPQRGERFARHKLNLADFAEKIILLRTDNLKFTDVIKRCCKERVE